MPLITKYKDNPMIVLNPTGRFQFQFGLSKAKLILEHIDAIRSFVNGQSAPEVQQTVNTANVTPEVAAMAQAYLQQYSADDDKNLI